MLAYAETLKKVGIALTIRQVDDAQYWLRLKTFDFDMIQWNWSASLSPGNEQVNRWSSAAADIQGSLNYPGVKNPAADVNAVAKQRRMRGVTRSRLQAIKPPAASFVETPRTVVLLEHPKPTGRTAECLESAHDLGVKRLGRATTPLFRQDPKLIEALRRI